MRQSVFASILISTSLVLCVQAERVTIAKSKYVTDVYVNHIKVGTSMACYTPIDCDVTRALSYGEDNEILIGINDEARTMALPKTPGGYLMTAAFTGDLDQEPVVSRRYLKVGDANTNTKCVFP